jgi:hypothetical protein
VTRLELVEGLFLGLMPGVALILEFAGAATPLLPLGHGPSADFGAGVGLVGGGEGGPLIVPLVAMVDFFLAIFP